MHDLIIAAIIKAALEISKQASDWVNRAKQSKASAAHQASLDLLLKQVEDLQKADVTHGGLVRELSNNLAELAKAVQQHVEANQIREEEIKRLSNHLTDLAESLKRQIAQSHEREVRTSRLMYCALAVAVAALATSLFLLLK